MDDYVSKKIQTCSGAFRKEFSASNFCLCIHIKCMMCIYDCLRVYYNHLDEGVLLGTLIL
jgi:hypothetical protein